MKYFTVALLQRKCSFYLDVKGEAFLREREFVKKFKLLNMMLRNYWVNFLDLSEISSKMKRNQSVILLVV